MLQVPEAWKDGIRQPQDNLPPTFTFSPSSGAPFKVLVTAGRFEEAGTPLLDLDALRKRVEAGAEKAGTQAVEKSPEVKELSGPACRGFYFSATDQAPRPGDFKYLTQGMARVGGILLVFTILTNDGQETINQAALEMVRGAVLHPGGTKR